MKHKLDKYDLEAEREGKAISKSLRLKSKTKKRSNTGRGQYITTTRVLNKLGVKFS